MEVIGTRSLKKLLAGGQQNLEINAKVLDNLNVFPVPDGDTGANMVATLRPGIRIATEPSVVEVGEIGKILTDSFSENSRGNSGFIMSRFFAGFFESAGKSESINRYQFARGFANGAFQARTSLFSPVEGTMITIMAAMAESLHGRDNRSIEDAIHCAIAAGTKALFETPYQLPVLAKAGVVDSGGLGFVLFTKGMLAGLMNGSASEVDEQSYRFQPDPTATVADPGPGHRYCTELTLSVEKTDVAELRSSLQSSLPEIGDSIALVVTDTEVRLHIHTDEPDRVQALVEPRGTVTRIKIDDMHDQMSLVKPSSAESGGTAIVALVPGDGFDAIYQDLGAAGTLVFGDTLPSRLEISSALEAVDEDDIILLPNDRNIVPVARLAADSSDRNVQVLPTAHVIQGLSAMYGYIEGRGLPETFRDMAGSTEDAEMARLYIAAHDTDFGGVSIRSGDYFGVMNDDVIVSGKEPVGVVEKLFSAFDTKNRGSATIFYGNDEGQSIAQRVSEDLTGKSFPLEIEAVYGGQSKSVLIIAIE